MSTVNVPQVNPNDEVTADSVNKGPNAIAEVVNGNIDSTNVSSLSGSKLNAGTVPASAMTTDANPETRMAESLANFIASGCVWSTTTGLNGAMTAGVAYVAGKRLTVAAVTSYAFTANRDTFVYLDGTGTPQYNPLPNGSTFPVAPSNQVLVAKVVTGASISSISVLREKPVGPSQTNMWYEEIGRVTLTAANATMTLNGLPKRRYLKIIASAIPNAATTIDLSFRLNGDSGPNYAFRYGANGSPDSTVSSGTQFGSTPTLRNTLSSGEFTIDNIASTVKSFLGTSVNMGSNNTATTHPERQYTTGKWVNTTDQVTSITMFNYYGGVYAPGTEMIVLGHD